MIKIQEMLIIVAVASAFLPQSHAQENVAKIKLADDSRGSYVGAAPCSEACADTHTFDVAGIGGLAEAEAMNSSPDSPGSVSVNSVVRLSNGRIKATLKIPSASSDYNPDCPTPLCDNPPCGFYGSAAAGAYNQLRLEIENAVPNALYQMHATAEITQGTIILGDPQCQSGSIQGNTSLDLLFGSEVGPQFTSGISHSDCEQALCGGQQGCDECQVASHDDWSAINIFETGSRIYTFTGYDSSPIGQPLRIGPNESFSFGYGLEFYTFEKTELQSGIVVEITMWAERVDGACHDCSADSCVQTTEWQCDLIGGTHTFAGIGTSCGEAGACCYEDNGEHVCADTEEYCCSLKQDYVFHEGLDCGDLYCSTGACCSESGCLETNEEDCQNAEGSFQGNGSTCNDPDICDNYDCIGNLCIADPNGAYAGLGACEQACGQGNELGACCLDGECQDGVHPDACVNNGGTAMGGGSNCASVDCTEPGACCMPDGSCEDVASQEECPVEDGAGFSSGTTCEDLEPGCEAKACCFDDDSCSMLTETACNDQDGRPGEQGSTCDEGCSGSPHDDCANALTDSDNDCIIVSDRDDDVEMNQPGKLVAINDDDDNNNGLLDNDPNETYVSNEDDLAALSLESDLPPEDFQLYTWTLTWDPGETGSNVRIWKDQHDRAPEQEIQSGEAYGFESATSRISLYIEGHALGVVSETILLTYRVDGPNGGECSAIEDTFLVTVMNIDAAIDSNNNQLIERDVDDLIEEITPKIMFIDQPQPLIPMIISTTYENPQESPLNPQVVLDYPYPEIQLYWDNQGSNPITPRQEYSLSLLPPNQDLTVYAAPGTTPSFLFDTITLGIAADSGLPTCVIDTVAMLPVEIDVHADNNNDGTIDFEDNEVELTEPALLTRAEPEPIELDVFYKPLPEETATYTLSWTGGIRLWPTAQMNGQPLDNGVPIVFTDALERTVYAEVVNEADCDASVSLTLNASEYNLSFTDTTMLAIATVDMRADYNHDCDISSDDENQEQHIENLIAQQLALDQSVPVVYVNNNDDNDNGVADQDDPTTDKGADPDVVEVQLVDGCLDDFEAPDSDDFVWTLTYPQHTLANPNDPLRIYTKDLLGNLILVNSDEEQRIASADIPTRLYVEGIHPSFLNEITIDIQLGTSFLTDTIRMNVDYILRDRQLPPAAAEEDDQIVLSTGELVLSAIDDTVPAPGLPAIWKRTYRSRSRIDAGFGTGWDHSGNYFVREMCDQADSIVLHRGNLHRDDRFTLNGNIYANDKVVDLEGRKDTVNQRYIFTFDNGIEWHFLDIDPVSRVAKIDFIRDLNGNTLQFTYNAIGQLSTVEDEHQRSLLKLAYDANRRIDWVETFVYSSTPRKIHYDYTDNKLASVHYFDESSDRHIQYRYETVPGLDLRLADNLKSVIDARGFETKFKYSHNVADARNTSDPSELGFDRAVHMEAANTGKTDIVYAVGLGAELTAIVNDNVGNVTVEQFDEHNRRVTLAQYTGRWDIDRPTFAADLSAPRTEKLRPTDPVSFTTTYRHVSGRSAALLERISYPLGNYTEFEYYAPTTARLAGLLWKQRQHVGTHPQGSITDQQALVTTYTYVAGTNWIKTVTPPKGVTHASTYSYDSAGNRTRVDRPDGSAVCHVYNGDGQVTDTQHPGYDSVSAQCGGRVDRTEYGTVLGSDDYGYITSRTVDNNNYALATTYGRDAYNNITKTTTPLGHYTTVTFTPYDEPEYIRSFDRTHVQLNETRNFYDASGQRVRVDTTQEYQYTQGNPDDYKITTISEYDAIGQVTRACTERIYDPDGTPYEDVAVGEATGDFDCEFDSDNHKFVRTKQVYDLNGQLTETYFGESQKPVDPDGKNYAKQSYDERSLPFQTRAWFAHAEGSDREVLLSTVAYDWNGNESMVITGDPDNSSLGALQTTTAIFDGFDRLISSTDPMGNVTVTHYDEHSNPGAIVVPFECGIEILGELTDIPGMADNTRLGCSNTTYDTMDRPISEDVLHFNLTTGANIGDGLSQQQTIYYPTGQVHEVTDDRGCTATTTYDTAGRVVTITDPKGNEAHNHQYDADSQVLVALSKEKSDIDGTFDIVATRAEYDGLGRVIKSGNVKPQGNYDEYLRFVTHRYDWQGMQRETVTQQRLEDDGDPVVMTRWMKYDGLGRLWKTELDIDGDNKTVSEQKFDDSSRLAWQGDGHGHKTRHFYDSMNRRILTAMADDTSNQAGSGATVLAGIPDWTNFTSGLDIHGNARMTVDANDYKLIREYDLLNRLTLVKRTVGHALLRDLESYIYNGLSLLVDGKRDLNVLTREDISHIYTQHDSMGNTIVHHAHNDGLPYRKIQTEYDSVGNMTKLIYPDGRTLSYEYDCANLLTSIKENEQPFAGYEFVGTRVARRTLHANGTVTNYSYNDGFSNEAGDFGIRNVTAMQHTLSNDPTATIDIRAYAWDMANNMRRRSLHLRPVAGSQDDDLIINQYFEHDLVNQMVLSERKINDQLVHRATIGLDVVGNRNKDNTFQQVYYRHDNQTQGPGAFDFEVNQYTMIPASSGIADAEYDDNGNLREMIRALTGSEKLSTKYTYSHRNELLYISKQKTNESGRPIVSSGNLTRQSRYDVLGRRWLIADRLQRHGPSGLVTETAYAGNLALHEESTKFVALVDPKPIEKKTYVYGLHPDDVLSVRKSTWNEGNGQWNTGVDYFFHADVSNNIVAVTDVTGQTVEHYDYHNDARLEEDRSGDFGRPTLTTPAQLPNTAEYELSYFDWSARQANFVADDYMSPRNSTLNGVRVWGGYDPDGTIIAGDFKVALYLDAGNLPSGAPLFEYEPIPSFVESAKTGRKIAGQIDEYEFRIHFDASVDIPANTKIWVVVYMDRTFDESYRFGWESADADAQDRYARSTDLIQWEAVDGKNRAFDLLLAESTIGNDRFFASRLYDFSTGLYYFRARYLDPVLGRFTTRDPAGIWADTANLGNGYTYAGNNPWSRVDPSGQMSLDVVKAFGRGFLEGLVDGAVMSIGFDPIYGGYSKGRERASRILGGIGYAGVTMGFGTAWIGFKQGIALSGLFAKMGPKAVHHVALGLSGADFVAGASMTYLGGERAMNGDPWGMVDLALGALNMSISAANLNAGMCFTGETLVLMGDGTYKRIDQIKVGDRVATSGTIEEVKAYQKRMNQPLASTQRMLIVSLVLATLLVLLAIWRKKRKHISQA